MLGVAKRFGFIVWLWVCLPIFGLAQNWEQALISKQATIDISWYVSRPFIYEEKSLQGLESDLMYAFTDYVNDRYGIEVQLKWNEADNFLGVLNQIRSTTNNNQFGISAFSITEDRKQVVKFTDSYLPDITVLVSSQGTPIVKNISEIDDMMKDMVAITIAGTVYEKFLLDLKSNLKVDFPIKYIASNDNVLETIAQIPNSFGFIDLPIYLMWIKNRTPLVRQNFFTVYGTGYGFILPKDSDWDRPFNEFLADKKSKKVIAEIISHHLGTELYEFIDNLYEGDLLGTSLLTKEKEIQLAQIKNANLKLLKEQSFQRFLFVIIGVCLLFLGVIGYTLGRNRKTNRLLMLKNRQIEAQQRDIQHKNEQLAKRNSKLMDLHEEKDYLINILAHDLRSPVSRIMGITSVMKSGKPFTKEEKEEFFGYIDESASRMNQMISKILSKDMMEGGKSYIMKSDVKLHDILADIEMRFEPEAQKKGIQLHLTYCKDNEQFHTDPLLLTLVLENLLSNALKYTRLKSKVSLEAQCSDHTIMFVVKDEGPGFSDDEKLRAFGRGQQLSAKPTADEQSTGLGLSIVKKYVNDLGGDVWLESEKGKGSAFFVRFDRNMGPFA